MDTQHNPDLSGAVVVARGTDYVLVSTGCSCGDENHGFTATVTAGDFYGQF